MSRKVFGYPVGDVRSYVPSAFGNRDSQDPVTVWIKSPTEKAKREIEGDGSIVRFSIGDNGEPLKDKFGNLLMHVDQEEATRRHHVAVSQCVQKVENYLTPSGLPIATGADLAEHGETEILVEAYNEIMRSMSLTEIEKKKLEGSPVC